MFFIMAFFHVLFVLTNTVTTKAYEVTARIVLILSHLNWQSVGNFSLRCSILFYFACIGSETTCHRTSIRQVQATKISFQAQNTGKSDKINQNECSSQNNTSKGFLKCKRTYFLSSVGIC